MDVGMAEILRVLPDDNPHRERITEGYLKMMDALLKYQEKDGMWRQLIDDKESWKETSGIPILLTYVISSDLPSMSFVYDIMGRLINKSSEKRIPIHQLGIYIVVVEQ